MVPVARAAHGAYLDPNEVLAVHPGAILSCGLGQNL